MRSLEKYGHEKRNKGKNEDSPKIIKCLNDETIKILVEQNKKFMLTHGNGNSPP